MSKQSPRSERPLLTLVKREVRRLNGYSFVRAFARFVILPPKRGSDGKPTRTITVQMVRDDGRAAAVISLAPDDDKPKDVRDLGRGEAVCEVDFLCDDSRVVAAVARLESVMRRARVAVPPSRTESAESRLGDLYAAVDAGEYALTRTPVKVIRNDSGRFIGVADPHEPCTGRRVRASKGGRGGLPIKHAAVSGRLRGSAPGGEPTPGVTRATPPARPDLSADDLAKLRDSRASEVSRPAAPDDSPTEPSVPAVYHRAAAVAAATAAAKEPYTYRPRAVVSATA